MGPKKSLPTQIKDILRYHVNRKDFPEDEEFFSLMRDLGELDEKVHNVKKQIFSNRKAREQAKQFQERLLKRLMTNHSLLVGYKKVGLP